MFQAIWTNFYERVYTSGITSLMWTARKFTLGPTTVLEHYLNGIVGIVLDLVRPNHIYTSRDPEVVLPTKTITCVVHTHVLEAIP